MIWLVCSIIGHPEYGYTIGYDPCAAFSWKDKAVAWAQQEVTERLTRDGRTVILSMDWRPDPEGDGDNIPDVLHVVHQVENYRPVETDQYALVPMALDKPPVDEYATSAPGDGRHGGDE